MKRKDRFVVGYEPSGNCIYGKDGTDLLGLPILKYIDPLTERQARARWKRLPQERRCIYELVPRPDLMGKKCSQPTSRRTGATGTKSAPRSGSTKASSRAKKRNAKR